MRIDGVTLEIVSEYVYLGVVIDKNGECIKKVENCVVQGRKDRSAINGLGRKVCGWMLREDCVNVNLNLTLW